MKEDGRGSTANNVVQLIAKILDGESLAIWTRDTS
jgi:hypothetical protein